MGIFDRFRGRNRIDDIDEAKRQAEIEDKLRERRRIEKEQAQAEKRMGIKSGC